MESNKLHKKLRLHDKSNICVLQAPDTFLDAISTLNYYTKPEKSSAAFDAVLVFARDQAALEELLALSANLGPKDVLFWACYPKLSSPLKSDINRDTLIVGVQRFGFRPVTLVAIDNIWSAMRLRPHDRVGKK